MRKVFLQIGDAPPVSMNEAKILVAIGKWEKTATDIARILPLSRSTIRDNLLMLEAKKLVKQTDFGFVNAFFGEELQKIGVWITKNEPNFEKTLEKS